MNVNIFEIKENFDLKIPSEIWLNFEIGYYFYFIILILSVFYLLSKKIDLKIFFFISSLLLLSNYIRNVYVIDEVMIGLEIPYNLFNHGKFSFSPKSMIDGSTDLIFLSFLVPFGFSAELLMHTNYIFCFLLTLISFYFIYKIIIKYKNKAVAFFLIIFASSQLFVKIWSPGFPSTLNVTLLIIAFYLLFKNNKNDLIKLCYLFPLVRPDGILFSASIFFILLIDEKKLRIKNYLLTFLSLIIYFIVIKYLYGHFKPTPMEFKSYGFNYGFIQNILPMQLEILTNTLKKLIILSIPPVVSIYLLKLNNLKKFLHLLFPFSCIIIFYSIFSMRTHWGGRYLGFIEIYFLILYSLIFLELSSNKIKIILKKNKGILSNLDLSLFYNSKVLIISTLIFFQLFQIQDYSQHNIHRGKNFINQDGNAVTGQILDKIIPNEWPITTTEINYVGYYMHDREVKDLIGYTNRDISSSNTFNSKGVKINPFFFKDLDPYLYWNRVLSEKYKKNHLWIDQDKSLLNSTYENIEKFMSFDNTSTDEFVVANIDEVLKRYDIYLIKYDHWTIVTLVNHKKIKEFQNSINQYGELQKTKKFNFERFKNFYNSENAKLIIF